MSHVTSPQLSNASALPSTADSAPGPTQANASDNGHFQSLWAVQSKYQRATLTSVAVSTGGLLLASASLDSNIVFIDVKNGQLIGVFDFKGRFYATVLHWCTDFLLYAGCSNGALLMITCNPADECPVVMQPILNPFDTPITAIALNSARDLLEVGCGGDTFMFSQTTRGTPGWDLVDHVSPPEVGRHGLVMALGFWGSPLEGYQLFIGHAKAGFCIWYGPHNYQQTPYSLDGPVCSIGSAAISTSGQFIAIATLDHAVVIYPLHQTGPVTDRRHVIPNQAQTGYRPIVPIALMPDRLVMRGSVSGSIPIVDLYTGPLSPIQNDAQHLVRTLAIYGDKVVVGLSDMVGQVSQIKCYLRQMLPMPNSSIPSSTQMELENDNPIFEVTIDNLEGPTGGKLIRNGSKIGGWATGCLAVFVQPLVILSAVLRCRRAWISMAFILIFSAILVLNHPALLDTLHARPLFKRWSTPTRTSAQHAPNQEAHVEYPELGYIFTCARVYVIVRLMQWGTCVGDYLALLLDTMFWVFLYLADAVPRLWAQAPWLF